MKPITLSLKAYVALWWATLVGVVIAFFAGVMCGIAFHDYIF